MSDELELLDDEEEINPYEEAMCDVQERATGKFSHVWSDDCWGGWTGGEFTPDQIRQWYPVVGPLGWKVAQKFINAGLEPKHVQIVIESMVKDKNFKFFSESHERFIRSNPTHPNLMNDFMILVDNLEDWARPVINQTIIDRVKNTPSK